MGCGGILESWWCELSFVGGLLCVVCVGVVVGGVGLIEADPESFEDCGSSFLVGWWFAGCIVEVVCCCGIVLLCRCQCR